MIKQAEICSCRRKAKLEIGLVLALGCYTLPDSAAHRDIGVRHGRKKAARLDVEGAAVHSQRRPIQSSDRRAPTESHVTFKRKSQTPIEILCNEVVVLWNGDECTEVIPQCGQR